MRKYYNEFNEEYERGYRAGRREALRRLDESDNEENLIEVNGKKVKPSELHAGYFMKGNKIVVRNHTNSDGDSVGDVTYIIKDYDINHSGRIVVTYEESWTGSDSFKGGKQKYDRDTLIVGLFRRFDEEYGTSLEDKGLK